MLDKANNLKQAFELVFKYNEGKLPEEINLTIPAFYADYSWRIKLFSYIGYTYCKKLRIFIAGADTAIAVISGMNKELDASSSEIETSILPLWLDAVNKVKSKLMFLRTEAYEKAGYGISEERGSICDSDVYLDEAEIKGGLTYMMQGLPFQNSYRFYITNSLAIWESDSSLSYEYSAWHGYTETFIWETDCAWSTFCKGKNNEILEYFSKKENYEDNLSQTEFYSNDFLNFMFNSEGVDLHRYETEENADNDDGSTKAKKPNRAVHEIKEILAVIDTVDLFNVLVDEIFEIAEEAIKKYPNKYSCINSYNKLYYSIRDNKPIIAELCQYNYRINILYNVYIYAEKHNVKPKTAFDALYN